MIYEIVRRGKGHRILKIIEYIFIIAVPAIFAYYQFFTPEKRIVNSEQRKELSAHGITPADMIILKSSIEEGFDSEIDKQTWNEYANTVTQIYKQLNENEIITINDSIKGKTGIIHKIDLSIKAKVASHNVLIAIKFLPIDRPLELQELKYFNEVFKDIDATKGVIVSNGGFGREEIEYSKVNLIELCKIKDLKSRKWNDDVSIPVLMDITEPEIIIEYEVFVDKRMKIELNKNIDEFLISTDKGKTTKSPIKDFVDKWNTDQISKTSNKLVTLYYDPKYMHIKLNNKWVPCMNMTLKYIVRKKYYFKYVIPKDLVLLENSTSGELELVKLDIGPELVFDSSWKSVTNPDDYKTERIYTVAHFGMTIDYENLEFY